MEELRFVWSVLYRVWPPCIRTAEYLGFHNVRQRFLLGRLNVNFKKDELERFLVEQGFERVVIAWRDPGEVLSLRKVDNKIFQYHVRLFLEGEIRAHYEYTPESSPWGHFWEAHFEPRKEFFTKLLGEYLIKTEK